MIRSDIVGSSLGRAACAPLGLLRFFRPGLGRVGATSPGLLDLGRPRTVGPNLRHRGEATDQTLEQFLVERPAGWGQGVVAPQAGLADPDQTRLAQVGQVTGSLRLLDAEDLDEVPHTALLALEKREDAKASPVGE